MVTKLPPKYPYSKNRHSFEDGLEFQDFVCDKMNTELGIAFTNFQSKKYQFGNGENRQGIEIKEDKGTTRTGNVSIEIAERVNINSDFVPSGIYRDDNSWLYIQGNFEVVYIFSKNILKLLHKDGRYKDEIPKEVPTIKRFLLPAKDARKFAAKVLEFKTQTLLTG